MKGCICKRTYHRTRGMILQNRAEQVLTAIYKYTDYFVDPPMKKTFAKRILSDYISKRIAHDQGGTKQNYPYVAAKKVLMKMIDDLADYVDIVADSNRDIIRLAGFLVSYDPIKRWRKTRPDNVNNLMLKMYRKMSGCITSCCEIFPPRTYFIALLLEGSPLPEGLKIFNNDRFEIPAGFNIPCRILTCGGRKKVMKGLTPGIRYYLYYIAYNNHGYSNLSKVATIMCC